MSKRCFVIQGFGKKQDYEQGKLFNLDASYEVIKEAIEDAGLECYRADELRTNALIDQVMYDQLLDADLVVADVTTLNFNAAYELGVRHALRPSGTLIIAEKGINFPFDIKHIYVHTYEHLGEDIGFKEAKRLQGELKELVQKAMSSTKKDSPVYTYLTQLPEDVFLVAAKPARVPTESVGAGASLRMVTDLAKTAMREDQFADAIKLWSAAREIAGKDDYIVQQLALATYKSKLPDKETALRKAETILEYLQPHGSFDTETLGLWATVHKRLFEITGSAQDLEEALFALERGFFIKQDHYNGINLAFVLDTKAQGSVPAQKSELRAVARYVRRKVIEICNDALKAEDLGVDEKYWILATIYEACVGLGEEEEALHWKGEADELPVSAWMRETTDDQVAKLRGILS